MIDAQRLHALLRDLAGANDEREFLAQKVTPLILGLGYRPEQIFYETSLPGPKHLRPDIMISAARVKRPWLIVAARMTRRIEHPDAAARKQWSFELFNLATEAKSEYSVLISPTWLCLLRKREEDYTSTEYDLRSLTTQEACELLDLLGRPARLPEERLVANIERPGVEAGEEQSLTLPAIAARARFRVDLALLSAQLEAAGRAVTNDEKKNTYERLAKLLMEGIPFLKCKYPNLRTRSSEIDLVIEYQSPAEPTCFDEFGRYILIESKNWTRPVGVPEVRDFLGKIGRTRTRLGVLFARNGITGSDGADAVNEIRREFDQNDRFLIVISEEDIAAVQAGASLYDILDRKIDVLRFDLR